MQDAAGSTATDVAEDTWYAMPLIPINIYKLSLPVNTGMHNINDPSTLGYGKSIKTCSVH